MTVFLTKRIDVMCVLLALLPIHVTTGLIMLSTVITVSITIPHFSAFAGVLIMVTFIMLIFYLPAATTLKKQKVETAGASSCCLLPMNAGYG
jgi:membrane-anchored glycerophosphoryl diester phosphodiesterase (GDPDase)